MEKLAQIETQNLDCKSPDFHEHFSAKSIDESKASVYFTPADGHLSPQPPQLSPIHVNYINENMVGCEAACGYNDGAGPSGWQAVSIKNQARPYPLTNQRRSFHPPNNLLFEDDEVVPLSNNFIIPEPDYRDHVTGSSERFEDVIEAPDDSNASLTSSSNDRSSRRRKKKYRERGEKRLSTLSIENEAFLMQEMIDVTKGARPKVYYNGNNKSEPKGMEKLLSIKRNSSK